MALFFKKKYSIFSGSISLIKFEPNSFVDRTVTAAATGELIFFSLSARLQRFANQRRFLLVERTRPVIFRCVLGEDVVLVPVEESNDSS